MVILRIRGLGLTAAGLSMQAYPVVQPGAETLQNFLIIGSRYVTISELKAGLLCDGRQHH